MRFEPRGRIDVLEQSGHADRTRADYRLLADRGIATVRDAFRWHLIEKVRGHYDWSSVRPMLTAAHATGTQVIWDLCHFGLPDGVDPWSAELVDRFAAFARGAARLWADQSDDIPVWCPVNEISYWAFAGGEHAHFAPFGRTRGEEWKRQLVRLAVAASEALREVDPRARLMHPDPVIHIVPSRLADAKRVEGYRRAMFDSWDMIAGRLAPELGGRADWLDIVGVNFYADNQWIDEGPRLRPSDPQYRPLREILAEVAIRYGRPLLIAETGAEASAGPAWLDGVMQEVALAEGAGVALEGICVYPVMDYPGWTDDRHCRCGLIEVAPDWTERRINRPMAEALARAARLEVVTPIP